MSKEAENHDNKKPQTQTTKRDSGQKLKLANPRVYDGKTEHKFGMTNTANWHATSYG